MFGFTLQRLHGAVEYISRRRYVQRSSEEVDVWFEPAV
jgi:hypothetical protein